MAYQVTAVPSDRLIIVDGEALIFDYVAPHAHMHALQWQHTNGHMEFSNAPSGACTYEDAMPYITLWEEEKARRQVTVPPTLEEAKEAKIAEIDGIAAAKITAGFWYEDATLMEQPLHFSFGMDDQSNFNAAMNGANLYLISQVNGQRAVVPNSIDWNGYMDEAHMVIQALTFNAEQFIAFWGHAETIHKNGILTQGRSLKEQVTQSTTVQEVQGIVWV